MGYSAIEKMKELNKESYGIPYPARPRLLHNKKTIGSIESLALRFLEESCEGLLFDPARASLLDSDGRSVKPNIIPFNMEQDINRMCLVNAIHNFMRSGVAQDAFDVYFCFMEMFFDNYANSRKMMEMLAEFESNSSSLLMKHRDHYSHSVYVFVLGMAIYESSELFRKAFSEAYGPGDARQMAHIFVKYWGAASLFHDTGYPFELPFEEVKSYFGGDTEHSPHLQYDGMTDFLKLTAEEKEFWHAGDINEVIANGIASRMACDYAGERSAAEFSAYLKEVLDRRPVQPGQYMDHAYFSALLLFKRLKELWKGSEADEKIVDAVTAVALHNSLFKFSVRNGKPLTMGVHPLAYMLMLCDELQCWDRTSYGQNSRRELHAMWCDIEFEKESIFAHYKFDKYFLAEKDKRGGSYKKMTQHKRVGAPVVFLEDIEEIVEINREDTIQLAVDTDFVKNNRETKMYISTSNFLHLYNFAVALNARYAQFPKEVQEMDELMEKEFDKLSLEYKMSNIMQAKSFAGYLDKIGCFYTDRPVVYEPLEGFSEKNMDVIGPMEHARWMREKETMGWSYGRDYVGLENEKAVRERTRTHASMLEDYNELSQSEQDKDTEPMNKMLELIQKYDGLRIYHFH